MILFFMANAMFAYTYNVSRQCYINIFVSIQLKQKLKMTET